MGKVNEGIATAIRDYCAKNPRESGRSLSISEFANMIGVSRSAVVKWMNGECAPNITDSCKICDYMGISLDEFAGRTVTG